MLLISFVGFIDNHGGCRDEQWDENPEQCDAKGEDKGDSSGNNGDDASKKSNCRQSYEKVILSCICKIFIFVNSLASCESLNSFVCKFASLC